MENHEPLLNVDGMHCSSQCYNYELKNGELVCQKENFTLEVYDSLPMAICNDLRVPIHSEERRLDFVRQRDGLHAAVTFAKQVRSQYRNSVLMSYKRIRFRNLQDAKPRHGSFPDYRRGFIESYVVAKRFIEEFENGC